MGTRMQQRRGTTAEWTAANPVLSDGELGYNRTTGEIRIGDGVTAWNSLPSSKIYIPKSTLDALYSAYGAIPASIVDAAGDLIVGSGADTVVRFAKGTDGQYLSVVAGALAWITPPATDLSSRVAKAGDTMTGALNVPSPLGVGDGYITKAVGQPFSFNSGITAVGTGVFDNGNRVYSASNPPPGAGGVTSVTGAYAVAASIGVVLANGSFTVTVPAAAANNGRVINIKNTGTGVITVATAGGNIDGQATVLLNIQYASVTLVSDGTNWFII